MVAMVLLLLAGVAKLQQPGTTTNAMQLAGLPADDRLTRLLGLMEISLAVFGVLTPPTVPAITAAALYLGFTAFVVRALRRGTAIQSCGCFGKTDTPPSVAHVFVNLGAAGVCLAYAVTVSEPLIAHLFAWEVLPLGLAVVVATYLTYVLLAILPATRAAARP